MSARHALIATAVVLAGHHAHAAGSLRATPSVKVIQTAQGTLSLANDTTDAVTITALTRDPGCDAEVTAELTTPALVNPGGAVSVTVKCAASVTTSMKRCGFHAMSTNDTLVDFEGVCVGGTSTTLGAVPASIDFGSVVVGASASQIVTLTNSGASTIAKLALQTTDLGATFELGAPCNPDGRECTAPIIGIGNGGTSTVTIACRPKMVGTHTAQLFVATDVGAYLATPIALTCIGTAAAGPVFALTGDPVDAGRVEVQNASVTPRPLHVTNAGTTPLTINGVQILDSGDGAAGDWTFTFGSGTSTCTTASCLLQPGAEILLTPRFDPNAIGSRNAVMVVTYTDSAVRTRAIPLTGTGVGATVSILDATELNFGTVPTSSIAPADTTSELSFFLYNQGNRSAAVDLAGPTGAFAATPPSMLALPPGMPVEIRVTCHPTAPGDTTSSITVTSMDASLATPIVVGTRCTGTNGPLYATPSTLLLGEVRIGADPVTHPVTATSGTGAQLQVVSATIVPNDNLMFTAGVPAGTPATFPLVVTPMTKGVLDDAVTITTNTNLTVRTPIKGTVVEALYSVPSARSLGTFCVNQPTTPDRIALTSSGTATILVDEPTLALGKMSPFDLSLQSPTAYPTPLAPSTAASIAISPKRANAAGVLTDELIWTTDVAGLETTRTQISAEFVDDGGAVAPSALSFGPTLIHLDSENAQRVTLQNCDVQPIALSIAVPPPFRVDIGSLPTMLAPNETATFSIGFHPTRTGLYMDKVTIRSEQFTDDLAVQLFGNGVTSALPPDGGVGPGSVDPASFYGCDGCSSRAPSTCAFALVPLLLLRRRRR